MVQRTVLKVDIPCQKCKRRLIKAVSRLQGVDKIEVDAAKSTLTVTGDADPVKVIDRIRKAGKRADVVSIGPPPPPPPPPPKTDSAGKGQKKPAEENKKPEEMVLLVHDIPSSTCPVCQHMGIYETDWSCSIL